MREWREEKILKNEKWINFSTSEKEFKRTHNQRVRREARRRTPKIYLLTQIIKKNVRSLCAECLKCVFFLFRQNFFFPSSFTSLSLTRSFFEFSRVILLGTYVYEISAQFLNLTLILTFFNRRCPLRVAHSIASYNIHARKGGSTWFINFQN